MRVCLEATSLRGMPSGVGHTTRELAEGLVQIDDDVEVVLFAMSAGRGPGFDAALGRPRISLRGGRPWVRAASWWWWRTEMPPVEVFCGNVDVFHGPNFLLPPMRRAAGVLTVHDVAFFTIPEMCGPGVLRIGQVLPRTAARAQRIITPSRFVADEIAAHLTELSERIRVVPMAVRDAFLDPRPLDEERAAKFGARDPYAVFLGNLETRKSVDVLLDAFQTVRSSVPDARLVLIGQPSVGWARIAHEHAGVLSSDAVRLAGYVDDDDVASLVADARVLVYPSRYEGFGLPPLEAMACGTPVIVSDAASLPEVVGPHATYVPVGDADALAAALAAALTATPSPEPIAAARAHARSFTWQRTAAETMRVYREAIEAR